MIVDISVGSGFSREILDDPDAIRADLSTSSRDRRYLALFQSVEAMVCLEAQTAIFSFIDDVAVVDRTGCTYLECLIELYADAYAQNWSEYPDPFLESKGYRDCIRAALEFGFIASDRTRSLAKEWNAPDLTELFDQYASTD